LKTSIQTTYWKDSLTLFRHTLSVTQQNPLIELLYGSELEKAKEYDEARQCYLRVHQQIPDQAVPLVHLSRVCMKQKKTSEAIQYARLACKTSNDQDPAVLENLARVLYDAGKRNEALDVLRQALELAKQQQQTDLFSELQTRYNKILSESDSPEDAAPNASNKNEDMSGQ